MVFLYDDGDFISLLVGGLHQVYGEARDSGDKGLRQLFYVIAGPSIGG